MKVTPYMAVCSLYGEVLVPEDDGRCELAKYLADKRKMWSWSFVIWQLPYCHVSVRLQIWRLKNLLGAFCQRLMWQALVKYNMITHKKMDHLTFIGMLKGENEYTYASYSKVQAQVNRCTQKNSTFCYYWLWQLYCQWYFVGSGSFGMWQCASFTANCDLKSISYLSMQLAPSKR